MIPRTLQRSRIVLRSLIAPPGPRGVHVLLYHKVGGEQPLEIDLPARLFRRQMEFLARTGRVVAYDEALRLLETGIAPPRDLFVLTFDDGYEDFHSRAFPVLRELGLPAVLFITTAFVEDGLPCVLSSPPARPVRPLSWAMLSDLHESGLVTLGAHTHTHVELTEASRDRALDELVRPQEILQRRIGATPVHFAYPRGRWSARVDELVRSVYDSAAVAGWSKAVSHGFERYRVPRVPILRRDGWMFFLAKTRGWLEREAD